MGWRNAVSVPEHYQRTHGGLTLSGGEALLHADKLLPVLEKCREEGIPVAVETCGHVPTGNVNILSVFSRLFKRRMWNPSVI